MSIEAGSHSMYSMRSDFWYLARIAFQRSHCAGSVRLMVAKERIASVETSSFRVIGDFGFQLAQEEQGDFGSDAQGFVIGRHRRHLLHSLGTSRFHLRRLHLRHRVWRLDSSELPPLLRGMMWSICRLTAQ